MLNEMPQRKGSEGKGFRLIFKLSYNQLSKAFRKMYVCALNTFKKIYL